MKSGILTDGATSHAGKKERWMAGIRVVYFSNMHVSLALDLDVTDPPREGQRATRLLRSASTRPIALFSIQVSDY